MLKQDPVSIEFFETTSASAKMLRESDLDFKEYRKIMKSTNSQPCEVDLKIFDGDKIMEEFSKISCRLKNAASAFSEKHPFIKDLDKEEKTKLFRHLTVKQEIDIEKVRERAEKQLKAMGPNVQKEIMKLLKKDSSVNMELLEESTGLDIEKLEKVAEPFSKIME